MEKEWIDIKRPRAIIIVLIVLVLFLCVLSCSIGRYELISPFLLIEIILDKIGFDFSIDSNIVSIVQYIRFPRTIAAFLVGGSLSLSGLVYQRVFNNPLVSPDILGVNAGCCVGAGVGILFGLSSVLITISAFFFGILSVLLSCSLPRFFKNSSNVSMILAGIIVSAFMNSIIAILKYVADEKDKLSEITFWMMGSLSSVSFTEILQIIPFVLISFILLSIVSIKIDVISQGYETALSLGVNYSCVRGVVILCATLLTASSVSLCGSISWVGLVVPHITCIFMGVLSKNTIPSSFLIGGIFLMLVDMIIRVFSTNEIPLSVVTGVLGAIIYTIILIKKGQEFSE